MVINGRSDTNMRNMMSSKNRTNTLNGMSNFDRFIHCRNHLSERISEDINRRVGKSMCIKTTTFHELNLIKITTFFIFIINLLAKFDAF